MKKETRGNLDVLLATVDEQRESGELPAVAEAFDRLLAEGYDESRIRDMCARTLAAEYFRASTAGEPFDRERYAGDLKRLPVMPWEDDGSGRKPDFSEQDVRESIIDNPRFTLYSAQELLALYERIRPKLREIHDYIIPLISEKVFHRSGHELGIMHGNVVLADSTEVLSVLTDYCIYGNPVERTRLIEEYRRHHEDSLDADHVELLRAMEESRYMLIRCEHPVPGLGLQGIDLLTGSEFPLVDINSSYTVQPDVVLATYVIAPYDVHMTTGSPLPIPTPEAVREVQKILESYSRKGERIDLSQDRGLFAAKIIRTLLRHGVMERVRFR